MNSDQTPVIAIEFETTLKKITDWLDYYRAAWPGDFELRPVIYLKPTRGGHDQRHYYHVIAARKLKVLPVDEYYEEDITQIDPDHFKLGLVRVDEVNPQTIMLLIWSENWTPPEIWTDLFDKLMMNFHPEFSPPQMVDDSLLKHLHNQAEDSILPKGKSGRPRDEKYDEAFERIKRGDDYDEVFAWWCEEENIKHPDKGVKDSFRAAMKRRHNAI